VGVDRTAEKLTLAREAGAVEALVFDAARPERVRAIAPGGVSVAIDIVGSRETLELGLGVLGPRGRLVLLTTFPGMSTELVPRRFVQHEIAVLGSRYASRLEVAQAGELVATGRIRPVVSDVRTLARVDEIH